MLEQETGAVHAEGNTTDHKAAAEHSLSRRSFVRNGAITLGGLALSGPMQTFLARGAEAKVRSNPDYGPLVPTVDQTTGLELLLLPAGFRYASFGWTGDLMADGTPTPPGHDGMAVVKKKGHRVYMVRNHELGGPGASFGDPSITYDPMADGGTTTLVHNHKTGQWEAAWSSIAGTVRNCAGGPTPWGSWLTCEETGVGPAQGFDQTHGWIFEVYEDVGIPIPLKDMGRFSHEAVAVTTDSIVYETEDSGQAGFYRFLPNHRRQLHRGGQLQMLRVKGMPGANLEGQVPAGTVFNVDWVDIPNPEEDTFAQGLAGGGAIFSRLEGAWEQRRLVYFISTDGGASREGQVWCYDPKRETLTMLFESSDEQALDNPDNITVSPLGGILMCEDGDLLGQRLVGLSEQGHLFPFAQNNIVLNNFKGFTGDFRGREWAGATFGHGGKFLYANIQTPGVTFAITGPWEKGPLD